MTDTGEADSTAKRCKARSVGLAVLALGLLATGAVALVMTGHVNRENGVRLAQAEDGLRHDLTARIDIYSENLVALQGLFAATDEVTRDEFATFIDAMDVFDIFPGLQGLSFSPVVYRSELADFERSVRADTSINGVGYPDFTVNTGGDADDLFIVDYIVPFAGNEGAFGFDLGSNPVRRAAIEEARDSGRIVATAAITLVQEEEEQLGVLLLAPAYSGPTDTIEERQANFIGVFSAVLRMGDFLHGASRQTDLGYIVFDQSPDQLDEPGGRTQMYLEGPVDLSQAAVMTTIDIGGREWGLAIDSSSVPQTEQTWALMALLGVVAALPYAVASYLSYRERDHLVRQADELRAANHKIRTEQEKMRAAQDALDARSTELETVNRELEQFIYLAAHDLQAPLRTISSYSVLVEDMLTDVPDEARDYLNRMTASTGRMRQLLVDLLMYARIGWDRDPEPVDLGQLAATVVDDVVGANDAEVLIGSLPTVEGHRTHLRLLLQNLLDNAVKFAKPDEKLRVRISSAEQDSMHIVSVEDNGVGFDAEYSDRVFSVFQRLADTDQLPGTGIGLAHCRKIARIHHGDAWATSTPGVGSTFSFSLAAEADVSAGARVEPLSEARL